MKQFRKSLVQICPICKLKVPLNSIRYDSKLSTIFIKYICPNCEDIGWFDEYTNNYVVEEKIGKSIKKTGNRHNDS